LKDLGTKVNKN